MGCGIGAKVCFTREVDDLKIPWQYSLLEMEQSCILDLFKCSVTVYLDQVFLVNC